MKWGGQDKDNYSEGNAENAEERKEERVQERQMSVIKVVDSEQVNDRQILIEHEMVSQMLMQKYMADIDGVSNNADPGNRRLSEFGLPLLQSSLVPGAQASYANLQLPGGSEVESPEKGRENLVRRTGLYTKPPEDEITEEGTERERSSVLMQVNSLVVPNQPSQVADQYAKVSPFID